MTWALSLSRTFPYGMDVNRRSGSWETTEGRNTILSHSLYDLRLSEPNQQRYEEKSENVRSI